MEHLDPFAPGLDIARNLASRCRVVPPLAEPPVGDLREPRRPARARVSASPLSKSASKGSTGSRRSAVAAASIAARTKSSCTLRDSQGALRSIGAGGAKVASGAIVGSGARSTRSSQYGGALSITFAMSLPDAAPPSALAARSSAASSARIASRERRHRPPRPRAPGTADRPDRCCGSGSEVGVVVGERLGNRVRVLARVEEQKTSDRGPPHRRVLRLEPLERRPRPAP